MPPVHVYSKPNCPNCVATKNSLKSRGVEFDETDIMEDDEAFTLVTQGYGYRQMPVVIAGEDHWSGHSEDKISSVFGEE